MGGLAVRRGHPRVVPGNGERPATGAAGRERTAGDCPVPPHDRCPAGPSSRGRPAGRSSTEAAPRSASAEPAGQNSAADRSRDAHASMTPVSGKAKGPAAQAAGPDRTAGAVRFSPMTGTPSGPPHWEGRPGRRSASVTPPPKKLVVTLVVPAEHHFARWRSHFGHTESTPRHRGSDGRPRRGEEGGSHGGAGRSSAPPGALTPGHGPGSDERCWWPPRNFATSTAGENSAGHRSHFAHTALTHLVPRSGGPLWRGSGAATGRPPGTTGSDPARCSITRSSSPMDWYRTPRTWEGSHAVVADPRSCSCAATTWTSAHR